MPRHGMAGAYSVSPFRHSVVPSFCHSVIIHFPIIISTTVAHIQLKFEIRMYLMHILVRFEFSSGSLIFDKVMPLEL